MPNQRRHRALVAVVALVSILHAGARAQTAEPAPGVPHALARERAGLVSDLRYDLQLAIPQQKDQAVTGRSVVRFRLARSDRALVLDFDPDRQRPVGIT